MARCAHRRGHGRPPHRARHPVTASSPILPPATIGILGGGQLGRMTALAARSMGYGVQVLDPSPDCAARPVVDRGVVPPSDAPEGAAELARACDVITIEIEQIAPAALAAAM